MSQQDLIRTLHESRDHAKDGAQLGDYACNCAEYIEAIWPSIQMMQHNAFSDGWDATKGTYHEASLNLATALDNFKAEIIRTLTPWRKR